MVIQRYLQIDSSQANLICGAKIKATGNLEIFVDSFLYTCLDKKWYRDLKDICARTLHLTSNNFYRFKTE